MKNSKQHVLPCDLNTEKNSDLAFRQASEPVANSARVIDLRMHAAHQEAKKTVEIATRYLDCYKIFK
jgi:hypothetical protein